MEDFFAPPTFKPVEALVALRRQLRELRPLVERQAGAALQFSWRASVVIELHVVDSVILARLADKPQRTPTWQEQSLASSEQVRGFVEVVRRALKRWDDED